MKSLEILKKGQTIFAEDAVEGKKASSLVANVNKLFGDMLGEINKFAAYAQSQISGDVNYKIVMAKSLLEYYPNFAAVKLAHDQVAKEEERMIAEYLAVKTQLLDNLSNLLKASQKEAVVSLYDLYEGQFQRCEEGHEVIILGDHNSIIITTIMNELEKELVVAGHFAEIAGKELSANYANVADNVHMCRTKANELYVLKPAKLAKINQAVETMKQVGEQVVFFETFVKDLALIGVSEKNIRAYEKALEKQYIPLKKSLQKDLKLTFVEICDIVADENAYQETDLENEENIAVKPVEIEEEAEAVEAPVEETEEETEE